MKEVHTESTPMQRHVDFLAGNIPNSTCCYEQHLVGVWQPNIH